jgi:DeoR/GlpR family transcriptional regulator of sugar metabolism
VLDDRKLTVLRAIVEDYVSTTEPVGSKSLVDRHHFDVSPATIRNDMAVLEEQGLLRATGKTIVVFNARPKMKTRPVVIPARSAGTASARPMAASAHADDATDEDEDE